MIVGNSVRLGAEFKDFDGVLYDPTDVKVKIYKSDMSVSTEAVPTRDSLGVFYYDYILTATDYAFEFSGEVAGFPILSRMPLRASTRFE